MAFPRQRMRRLRQHESLRRLVRETTLSPDDFIYPLFVVGGKDQKTPINSMPGQFRWSIDLLVKEAGEAHQLGIQAVMIFGVPEHKDARGTSAYDPQGIVQQAVRVLKSALPDLLVITDVCIDEYTDHGHCGILNKNDVHNDITIQFLQNQAISHASSGADMIAPSAMMDGMVGAIRSGLDDNDFDHIPIISIARLIFSISREFSTRK